MIKYCYQLVSVMFIFREENSLRVIKKNAIIGGGIKLHSINAKKMNQDTIIIRKNYML